MDETTSPLPAANGENSSPAEVGPEELATWRAALAEEPRPGDLATLTGYRKETTPWRFKNLVNHLALVSEHLLVVGADQSDLIETIADVLPEDTALTVDHAHGVAPLAQRIAPREAEIVVHQPDAPGATMPFAPDRFDLVVVRHHGFDATEIHRVLVPGGLLVTEQVGGDDSREILAAFSREHPSVGSSLQNLEREVTTAGFGIERSDVFRGRARFEDMPTLLRFLRRFPDLAPAGLDVDRDRDALLGLAAQMADGPLTTLVSRYWLQARLPEAPRPPITDFAELLGERPVVPEV